MVTNHLREKEQSRPIEDKENHDFDLVRGKGKNKVAEHFLRSAYISHRTRFGRTTSRCPGRG